MKITRENLHMFCHDCGDCLLWKLGVNSQGQPCARIDGKRVTVRRYVYEHVYGRQVRATDCIATRCGNSRCLAKNHLLRRTRSQLIKQQYLDGMRNTPGEYLRRLHGAMRTGPAKINMEIARQIRAERGTQTAIAAKYGISRPAVSQIRRGRTWRETTANASIFTMADQFAREAA
jgi:hypothetical protein